MSTADWAAVVLTGGRARRLGGLDKAGVEVAGRTLLDHALAAVSGASPIVVVGPRRDVDGVVWTREDPPGGGPVAGLAAGLALVDSEFVAVLAVDQPGVTASTVDRLRAAVDGNGAVLVDADGHKQWLIGVWRVAALRAALPAQPEGASLRSVLTPLAPAELAALPGEALDVDTPDDLKGWAARPPARPPS